MQEQLIYTNSNGESVEFSTTSIYHCNVSTDVDGLTDIKNTVYTSSAMEQHGDTYIGHHIEPRDIEISGSINTKSKSEALTYRRELARILSPERAGTLLYVADDFRRVINVKPEDALGVSRKKVLFDFDVNFIACSPFWTMETESKDEIADWVASWEFDAEIDADDGMIFAYREPSLIVNCYNDGDVDTGLRIVFTAIGSVVNPQLMNIGTGEYIQINQTLQSGDTVTVNTAYGQKGATLLRNGVETNYFRYIDVDSTFMQLGSGDNLLRYAADDGLDNLEVTVYHKPEYLGV